MAEIGGAKPDETKLHWADGESANPTTEPSESKKDDGFVYEDIPPSAEENWFRMYGSNLIRWLTSGHAREFEYLNEAIGDTECPDIFRVRSPATGMQSRGGSVFNVQGAGGAVSILDSCTDGEYYYYAQQDIVYAANTISGSTEWTKTPKSGSYPVSIDCDGRYVIVAYSYQATGNDLFFLDKDDGTILYSVKHATALTLSMRNVASNGKYLAVLHWQSLAGATVAISIYDISASPALVGTGSTVTPNLTVTNSIAIDDEYAFAAYGDYYIKINLTTYAQTATASTSIFTSTTLFSGIATDGLRVYVVTYRATLIAGGQANLLVFNRENDNLVLTRDFGAINLTRCTLDGNFLYFSTGSPSVLTGIVEKYDCIYTWGTISGILVNSHCADGISFFGTDGYNNITRNWIGATTKTYQRVLGTDPVRRPFYNSAIPAHDEE